MNQLITDAKQAAALPHKYLTVLAMVWVSILIVGMFTAVKTFTFAGIVFSVAIIAYPFTYLFADIFTEVYGFRVTRKIVWTGFAAMLLVTTLASLYSFIPGSEYFTDSEAFNLVFRASPLIAVAGVIAFFSGEFTNSIIVAKLKVAMSGRHEWVRLISSTFFGQLVDNTIFFTGAFLIAGWYTPEELFPLVASSVAFTTIWEVIALPITYRVIGMLKRAEGVDAYDTHTSFSPFGQRERNTVSMQ